MIYELFQLSDKAECDYDSYSLTLSVYDLINKSHSSNIQRLRNPKKEDGIMKFIKDNIDRRKTPFFQPFILHYTGKVSSTSEGKHILDAIPNFEAEILVDNEPQTKLFEFEVIDGNGRMNAMIKLYTYYTNEILDLTEQLNLETSPAKLRKYENKIYDLKNKLKTLKDLKLVIQLYTNLSDEQKAKLFNAVNQGEKMTKGRLNLYNNEKIENVYLNDYIAHVESLENFQYIITPDKDTLRTDYDRKLYIPAIFILPVIRKLIRYAKVKDIIEVNELINTTLDRYILKAQNPPHLRKHYFSVLGSVITEAESHAEDLSVYIDKMLEFDYTKYLDISKQLKLIRQETLAFVFNKNN